MYRRTFRECVVHDVTFSQVSKVLTAWCDLFTHKIHIQFWLNKIFSHRVRPSHHSSLLATFGSWCNKTFKDFFPKSNSIKNWDALVINTRVTLYTDFHNVNNVCSTARTSWVRWYQKLKPLWIILQSYDMTETVEVASGAAGDAKFQSDHLPEYQHAVFYRPDVLPTAEPPVSQHWRRRW